MPSKIDLTASITLLSGVGLQRARLLKEQKHLATLADLLTFIPSKHIDRSGLYRSDELTPDMPFVQLRGQILSFEEEGAGRKRRLVAHFYDGGMEVDLVWYNSIR